ncbi:hypothetical protein HOLleu_28299 [Holothuria leucospilota]|uniref:BRICHOS domain-containing protein n=1 Tax=Holothuria leucospilota TaxID=206669 RepID=A0A9Q1BM30_HOLLE|nr:hypothetical protein HOLleu_28299 [Holothuria leucospilota]
MAPSLFIGFLLVTLSTSATPLNKLQHLRYKLDGAMHDETAEVRKTVVTLTDNYEGFVVMLDYHRNLLTIKNTTDQTCFFSRLDKDRFNEKDVSPVFVTEVPNSFVIGKTEPDVEIIVLSAKERIPTDFAVLTSDVTVAEQCTGLTSYWLVEESTGQRSLDPTAVAKRWPKIKIKIKICIKIERD